MSVARFCTQTFHFLLCCLIHHKATLLSDQQNTPERSILHSTTSLTVTINLNNSKHDINSNLGMVYDLDDANRNLLANLNPMLTNNPNINTFTIGINGAVTEPMQLNFFTVTQHKSVYRNTFLGN